MVRILKNTTSYTRENTRFRANIPGNFSYGFYRARVVAYIYNCSPGGNEIDPYDLGDEELTHMVVNLSQSSLSEVWDNQEDEFWDTI